MIVSPAVTRYSSRLSTNMSENDIAAWIKVCIEILCLANSFTIHFNVNVNYNEMQVLLVFVVIQNLVILHLFMIKILRSVNPNLNFSLLHLIVIIWTGLSAFPKIKMIVGCGQVNLAIRIFAKLIVVTVKPGTVIACYLTSNLVKF